MKTLVNWNQINNEAARIVSRISSHYLGSRPELVGIFGVPRGGIVPAALVWEKLIQEDFPAYMVEDADHSHVIIDDVVDSGATREQYQKTNPNSLFFALFEKEDKSSWLSFPWERMGGEEAGVEDNVRRLIQYIGDDPERNGLKDTPRRVAESYKELYSGYTANLEEVFRTFDQPCDEMVILKGVEYYSFCEHHMLPFFGQAHIGYIPNDGKVAGISKLARVLEVYSRRLQNQERICSDVTKALEQYLKPLGAACVLEGSHFCMRCRGVNKQNSVMITSSLTGKFRDPAVRSEFFSLIKG